MTENNQNELSTTFSPKDVESKWYKTWEDGKYFKPRKGKANEAYCIIMPPPNVTGILHAGHALDVTTQDTLIRWKRMKGFEALWLPGMDHAGIATQSVVEKQLQKEEGKNRHDFTREEFLEKIWDWKDEKGGIIAKQQKVLGASPDWDYSMFTMDPEANEAVRKAFVTLFNEGLIYQSDYIINWDPVLQSAISDAEVEHKEVQGAFYHILYSVKDSDIKLEVATTRPETLLGDTAVAVNPNDERFAHLIGKMAIVPLCNREVPIIGDEHVDIEVGTGCLKVTPGHDFNDFEIGQRHNLEVVNIINLQEYINQNSSQNLGEVIACAASNKVNTEITYVFYYPFIGATEIQYFETESTSVNPNIFSNYNLKELNKEPIFNGKLERFVKESNQEVWCIITFIFDGKLHKSNPIRIKNQTKPSEWTADVTIDFTEQLKPKFSWLDGNVDENEIYFEVLSDNQNDFLSGTYTTDKWFQYKNSSNVVLDINITEPVNLATNNTYNFTMMGVSEDNWVNLIIEKQFTAQ